MPKKFLKTHKRNFSCTNENLAYYLNQITPKKTNPSSKKKQAKQRSHKKRSQSQQPAECFPDCKVVQIECLDNIEKELKNPFNEFLSFQGKLQFIQDKDGLKIRKVDEIAQDNPLMIIDEISEKDSVSKASLISLRQEEEFKTLSKYNQSNLNEYQFHQKKGFKCFQKNPIHTPSLKQNRRTLAKNSKKKMPKPAKQETLLTFSNPFHSLVKSRPFKTQNFQSKKQRMREEKAFLGLITSKPSKNMFLSKLFNTSQQGKKEYYHNYLLGSYQTRNNSLFNVYSKEKEKEGERPRSIVTFNGEG